MLVGKRVEGVLVCRIASAGSLRFDLRIELHLFEKQGSDLLRRHDVEVRLFCHLPHSVLDGIYLGRKGCRISAELHCVDLHAFDLHLRQDLQQRFLHRIIKSAEVKGLHLLPDPFSEHKGCRSFRKTVHRFFLLGFIKKRKGGVLLLRFAVFEVYAKI